MIPASARQFIGAYKAVCEAPDPYVTYDVLNDLERHGIQIRPGEFSGMIPASLEAHIPDYLGQVLLRSSRSRANPLIMTWIAGDQTPAAIPYPQEWRNILRSRGMPLTEGASRLSFFVSQCRAWYRALTLLKDMGQVAARSYQDIDKAHVFSNVPPGTLPIEGRTFQTSTLFDWARAERNIPDTDPVLIHCISAVSGQRGQYRIVPYVLPKLSAKAKAQFHFKSARVLMRAFAKWTAGNWKAPFVASAAIENAYFECVENPASAYYFSNSEYAIRPFWTYAAEKRGSDIVLYFYSANINCFYKGQKENSPPPPGYISMSWPHYWVLDDEQEDFLRNQCQVAGKIKTVGSIDFTDSDDEMLGVPERSVALFDIPVFNVEHVAGMALIAPYYVEDIMASFLSDVSDCVKAVGGHVIWKMKREIPAVLISSHYSDVVNELCRADHVIRVPAGIAARRVLKKVDASISIPFTSTAVLSKELGHDSAYYDPTAALTYTRGLSRGLPLLKGRQQLQQWLERVLDKEARRAG